ncbi:hypothetical protein [Candidatus Frankia nodulisporulans]|uniref:hypothetical protein n=1 Tax=Candidatus Frankia nodulisporulans TaxID=2060052 RepID=UPI0013D6F8D3|nr:hypothetical protein [Candidatus Frankia nodulisporulans]
MTISTIPLSAAAPARTARQIAALRAAVSLLERLGSTAALALSVHTDFAPSLPVRLDAQVSKQDDDHGPDEVARFDRLNAAAVALHAPIVHLWASRDGHEAFGLAGVVIDGVPVHLWTSFTDSDLIAAAHQLVALGRR